MYRCINSFQATNGEWYKLGEEISSYTYERLSPSQKNNFRMIEDEISVPSFQTQVITEEPIIPPLIDFGSSSVDDLSSSQSSSDNSSVDFGGGGEFGGGGSSDSW